MRTQIYWSRNDLRLTDNPALARACREADALLPVYVHAPDEQTTWGFARVGAARRHFVAQALEDLGAELKDDVSTSSAASLSRIPAPRNLRVTPAPSPGA